MPFLTKSVLGWLAALAVVLWIVLYCSLARWEPRVEEKHQPMMESSQLQLTNADSSLPHRFASPLLSKIYKPLFTASERLQSMNDLKVLTDALDKAGIDYFLYGGSLIGSWRHHDIVPWDDDIDIIVNKSSIGTLQKLRIPGHTMNAQTKQTRYKFYCDKATDILAYSWKWPFIDISFFGDNGTHLVDTDPQFSKAFTYDKQDVLPLVRRPFGELYLKTPKNTLKALEKNYNISICQTGAYNHKMERILSAKDKTDVDCKLLYKIYPFVIRDNSTNSHIENVYLDGKLTHSVDLDSIQ